MKQISILHIDDETLTADLGGRLPCRTPPQPQPSTSGNTGVKKPCMPLHGLHRTWFPVAIPVALLRTHQTDTRVLECDHARHIGSTTENTPDTSVAQSSTFLNVQPRSMPHLPYHTIHDTCVTVFTRTTHALKCTRSEQGLPRTWRSRYATTTTRIAWHQALAQHITCRLDGVRPTGPSGQRVARSTPTTPMYETS